MSVPLVPASHLVRSSDPDTSLAAALKASKASKKAAKEVLAVMEDGIARLDPEIWETCRSRGYLVTRDTIEHARHALEMAGRVVETGVRRQTSNGSPAREWILAAPTQQGKVLLQVKTPLTKMVVHIHYIKDKVKVDHSVFEGEVTMTQQQADAYKALIGDGKASVTASKEISESDYGNGGKIFVSVTLTVDQSADGLANGIAWAKHFADAKAWEAHAELKTQLQQRNILK